MLNLRKRPVTGFLIVLALTFGIIVLGNLSNKPKMDENAEKIPAKQVEIYQIGTAPKIQLQGKVEKSGIVQIVAQTSGVVNKVIVKPGDKINRGNYLVNLSSNYNGANIPGLQAAMSKKQNDLVNSTYDSQKSVIDKQKQIAQSTSSNTDELRDISKKSLDDTKSMLSLNEEILKQLDDNISSATTSASQFPYKQLKSQYLSATTQIKSQIRQLEYQTNTDKPPTQLANLQKEIAITQLDIQSKTLDLNKEISNIQLQLAYVAASYMNPSSPISGVVERVYVQYGQLVAPGTPIALISQTDPDPTVMVQVPREIAKKISMLESSVINVGPIIFTTTPSYISAEATDGQLYTAYFTIPESYASYVTDKSYITVEIPIGYPDTGSIIPFIPLDAVFQTQDGASVNLFLNKKAKSRDLKLGQVYGRYVQVISGLTQGDQVILNRNIVEGDEIQIKP